MIAYHNTCRLSSDLSVYMHTELEVRLEATAIWACFRMVYHKCFMPMIFQFGACTQQPSLEGQGCTLWGQLPPTLSHLFLYEVQFQNERARLVFYQVHRVCKNQGYKNQKTAIFVTENVLVQGQDLPSSPTN